LSGPAHIESANLGPHEKAGKEQPTDEDQRNFQELWEQSEVAEPDGHQVRKKDDCHYKPDTHGSVGLHGWIT
jgi:hypothetical protein